MRTRPSRVRECAMTSRIRERLPARVPRESIEPRARLASIQVGSVKPLRTDSGLVSAFVRSPVNRGVYLARVGLAGDEQGNRESRGGPEKAVCAYPTERNRLMYRHRNLSGL